MTYAYVKKVEFSQSNVLDGFSMVGLAVSLLFASPFLMLGGAAIMWVVGLFSQDFASALWCIEYISVFTGIGGSILGFAFSFLISLFCLLSLSVILLLPMLIIGRLIWTMFNRNSFSFWSGNYPVPWWIFLILVSLGCISLLLWGSGQAEDIFKWSVTVGIYLYPWLKLGVHWMLRVLVYGLPLVFVVVIGWVAIAKVILKLKLTMKKLIDKYILKGLIKNRDSVDFDKKIE
ncbi:hypothetical protein [Desulfobacula toluolica]|uniref:Uncharacterized protein n=1 Tax=Desulfobacula toluolica (strain DSM 7467 / Tol2) TaxID=651182 RepID=K0NCG4_DESTT|nr:hypothetical protein [Desulfobacula toluolica]CCK82174.1 uncharacterized protein TOL2_C40190 [Desulfobacula toluolica Tol2]